MLTIETSGSWEEMGEQIGRTFPDILRQCMDQYAPWLFSEPGSVQPVIEPIRSLLEETCPQLLEETGGLARGADMDPDIVLGYRFLGDVRTRMAERCSVVYVAESASGPLLGRNCDLEPGFEAEIQLRRICRPEDGTASIQTTYLGMAGGVGLNGHGLGTAGASAHTPERYGDTGLPGHVLNFLMLNGCRNTNEVRTLMAAHAFWGKSYNLIVGDAAGASVLLEMAPGRTPVQVDRTREQDWQGCTNFFMSGEIPISPEVDYLQSAYARYGRMAHQFSSGRVERSVSGLKQLMTEIAQPGFCDTGRDGKVKTAYSQVMELRSGKMYYTPGHPAETAWETAAL